STSPPTTARASCATATGRTCSSPRCPRTRSPRSAWPSRCPTPTPCSSIPGGRGHALRGDALGHPGADGARPRRPGVGHPGAAQDLMTAGGGDRLPAGTLVVLGGRSEIGLEVAERLAPGREIVLAARRSDDLADEGARLLAAGASAVHTVELDADDTASHPALIDKVVAEHGPLAVAVLAFGILGDQALAEHDPAHALAILQADLVA